MKKNIDQKIVTSANKDFYNEVAENYLIDESYAYTDAIVKDVKKLLDIAIENTAQKKIFLDIGCGSGFISKIVSEKKIFNHGVGIDISEKQIELYEKNLENTNFKGKVCDVNDMSFLENESVDLICGYSVLHHFFDYYNVLDECLRVLKKGGIIYCDFEPNYQFKKNLKLFIKLRKIFFDKSPSAKKELEEIAEYHNNYKDGLNFSEIKKKYENQFELLSFNYRYPGTFSGNILKSFSFFGNFVCPLFNFIFKKK